MVVEHELLWDDEKIARLWDYLSHASPAPYFSEIHGEQILHRSGIPLGSALEVCDFGCGPGFIWDHLTRLNAKWRYTGVDFSAKSVSTLQAKAEGQPGFVGAEVIETLPTSLPENHFDVVLLIEVVEHLSDEKLQPTLREAVRILKPGGRLVVSTPNDENLAEQRKFCAECGAKFHEWQHVRSWSADSLTRHMAEFGFLADRIGVYNFSAVDIPHKSIDLLKRLLQPSYKKPHMLAVFRKS